MGCDAAVRRLALCILALTAACATPPPRSFDALADGYPEGRLVWAPRAKLWIYVARLGPASSRATPVVLLHPWGLSMRVWSVVGPALAEERPVLLVDLPGHGKSEKLHAAYGLPRYARAVLDVMDAHGIARAVVVGNSLGGATAVEVSLTAPDRVAGLGLIAAPGGAPIYGIARRFVRHSTSVRKLETLSDDAWSVGMFVVARGGYPASARLLDDALCTRGTDEWAAWSRATHTILRAVAEYAPAAESVRAKTLVVHGAADLLITRDVSEAYARRIPDAELVNLPGCGHMPEVECPQDLLRVLAPFVAQADATTFSSTPTPSIETRSASPGFK